MNIELILKKCAEESVELSVEEGSLDVLFDEHPSDELLSLLKDNKVELIHYISEQQDSLIDERVLTRLNETSAPLSYSQKRLWFIDQLDKGSAQYNMPLALKLDGLLDVTALNKTFNKIIQRHEILRTVYGQDDQRQYIRKDFEFLIEQVDLSAMTNESDKEKEIKKIAEKEATKLFSLDSDLMIRACLLKLTDNCHILLITIHHIASDGWSLGILVDDFASIYENIISEQESLIGELPVQYSDYAYWQEENVDLLEDQTSYWIKQLEDLPSVHSLPLDNTRPDYQTYQGNVLHQYIPEELTSQLNQLCRRANVTLFMLLHSAFSLVLSRWSNTSDIVIGTPIAGRNKPELDSLIGYFVNTLVLRSEIKSKATFEQLLQQNRTMLLEAYEHQDVPFEMLVDRLQPERSLSHSPLFQIFFTFHNQQKGELKLPSIEIADITEKSPVAKFDLELSAVEHMGKIELCWNSAVSIFDSQTIERVSESYLRLLEQLVDSISQEVSEYSMLPKEDEQQLAQWCYGSEQAEKSAHSALFLEQFSQQVKQKGDDIALVFAQENLTYTELDKRSNQLAHYLLGQGVDADSIIGLKIERTIDMVVGLFGILKSGAAYLPLEIGYPESRLNSMLEDSDAHLVLTESHITQQSLTSFSEAPIGLPQILPEQRAYLIYTSGSTGIPKGVMISHENMKNFITAMKGMLQSEQKNWLAVTGISFDISVLEIFGTLVNGYKVVIAPDQKLDKAQLAKGDVEEPEITESIADLIERHSISHLQCTPSFALMNLTEQAKAEQLSSLTKLFIGGEALPVALVEKLKAKSDAQIINMYGPTEATVWSTSYPVLANDSKISIGKPLSGYQCFVLGMNKTQQPVGCPGELFIAGKALSQGYFNRSELTEEKFIENTVSGKGLMYATGDRVCWNRNGQLEFLGRVDSQVKLRGFRIEPGEIEHHLNQFSGVNASAVVLREINPGDQRLVAYIESTAPVNDIDELSAKLEDFLSETLPNHMVPGIFVLLDQLPKTLNDKINRKLLPEPIMSGGKKSDEPPKSETEKAIAGMWQGLLKVKLESIGRNDNFFNLGGHSLLLTQLISEIKIKFSVELSMREAFEHSTLSKIAGRVDSALKDSVAQERFNKITTGSSEQTEELVI